MRVPGTARTSNQSILKEINPEYSLEGLMPKLKLQHFDHVMSRANSLEKTLMLGKSEGKRRREQQRMRWLDSTTNSMDMNLSNLQEIVKDREARHASPQGYKVSGMTWQVNNTIVRIHLSIQGTWVQSLVWENSTYRGASKPVCHND